MRKSHPSRQEDCTLGTLRDKYFSKLIGDQVEQRSIGNLQVSVVGIGCNNFGGRLDAAGTDAVVNSAIDAGINFFDTADVYGETRSELLLGKAVGARRDQVIIASKFGLPIDDKKFGAHPDYIRSACEDSLKRLGSDHIDLYQLHAPDASVPLEDSIAAMQQLQDEGKVIEIGCSNFNAGQLHDAATKVGSGSPFRSVQNQYSLLWREAEDAVLGACGELSMGLLPYYPLANGLLTGKIKPGEALPEGTRLALMDDSRSAHWLSEEMMTKVQGIITFAEEISVPVLELAFAWLLSHPAVSSVIAGASSPSQVEANAKAGGRKLSPEIVARLNAITA